MNENKVGLEAEFFVRKNKGLVFPADYGFSCDDFCLLGEFRAKAASSREETIANFIKEYYEIIYKAEKKGVEVDIQTGWDKIDPKFYAQIIRKMGSKSVAACLNIYNTDILQLTDAEVEGGKILAQKISCGLHVHFSSEDIASKMIKNKKYTMKEL